MREGRENQEGNQEWKMEVESVLIAVGILSATASLGLILLWDVECGLTQIDKFLYSSEDYVKVGKIRFQ